MFESVSEILNQAKKMMMIPKAMRIELLDAPSARAPISNHVISKAFIVLALFDLLLYAHLSEPFRDQQKL